VIDPELLLRASDLFNRKLYFECHDLLEEAWSEARGEDRDLLQALIHLSVGLYHLAAGNHKGARSQLEMGVRGLGAFLPAREGLDLLRLSGSAERCLAKIEDALAGKPVEWRAEDVPRITRAAVE
jgi:predicted metal-dependent hydrolase